MRAYYIDSIDSAADVHMIYRLSKCISVFRYLLLLLFFERGNLEEYGFSGGDCG